MDLQAIAPIIQEEIKLALRQKVYPFGFAKYRGLSDKVASGRLVNSVQVVPVQRQNEIALQIFMEDYGQWVQSGRLPGKKGVPINSLISWIKSRKIKGRDKKGRYIKDISFAFAIQKNIKKFGIRPSNFFDKALDNIVSNERIIELLENATAEDLINIIEGI